MCLRALVFLLLTLSGCAHESAQSCLDAETATQARSAMEKLVDHTTKISPAKSTLLESSCLKQKSARSGYRVVVYKSPTNGPREVQASMVAERAGAVDPTACLADAEKTLESFNLPHVTTLISRVHGTEEWRWFDADIGPSKWLECGRKRGTTYFDKLQTFVHELNHEAREDNCLYIASERTRRCFDLPKELPLAKFARLQAKATPAYVQEMLDWVLDLYLGPNSQNPPLVLFDELNAYTLGTEVQVAAYETVGKRALFDAKGSRSGNFLALFLAQTAAYLTKLKKTDAPLYERTFAKSKENYANLLVLFARGEAAYGAWVKIASATKKDPMVRVENELWNFYTELKKGLGLDAK